jgi:hypothetical protein
MTPEAIKEELSSRCIEALANRLGYATESVRKDYGIDLRIIEIAKRKEPSGKMSYFQTNKEIKIQLKATTEKQIRLINDTINFDLKVKNYNDIVHHLNNKRPTYLFLIVMPDDEKRWLEFTPDELILRSRCYWYIHPKGTLESKNKDTHVVQIPVHQMIEMNTFAQLLTEIYK